MSSPAAFNPKLTAWAHLSRAATSAATCKFALCAVDGGKGAGAGKIARGALILTPVNTHCGGKMGAYHGACFFLAQDAAAAAMDPGGAGPVGAASDSADSDSASSAIGAPRWSHVSPFTNVRFALVRQHPADSGSLKTADAAVRCATPLRRVEELLGWAALSAEEQAQLRAASRLVGTGAGTKMKGGKRKFDEAAGAVAAADGESNGSDAAEEEADSKPSRGPATAKRASASNKKVAAASSSTRAKRSKQAEAAPAKAAKDSSAPSPTTIATKRTRR